MSDALGNGLRGLLFFSLFWPSYTRLGFAARQLRGQAVDDDLGGQTWLVTGASAGIGAEIATAAARLGARVIAVARRPDALATLAERAGGLIEPRAADLSLMADVRELATTLPPVDVLVNNVGTLFNRRQRTAEDLDAGFATNLLGHYVLTENAIAAERLVEGGAVVTMTSGGGYTVPLRLDAVTELRPYDGTLAYAYHKRAQIVLNAYWRQRHGDRFRFYVTHPGWAETPGVSGAMPAFRATFGPILRTPAEGADTALWLGASRPAQRRVESVWFDRAEHPAHLLPGTRAGATTAELIELLERYRQAAAPAAAA